MTVDRIPDRPTSWSKSDEIMIDTSATPWMAFAKAELGKKVHELGHGDGFITSMRVALHLDAQQRALEQINADFGRLQAKDLTNTLLGTMTGKLPYLGNELLGEMEAQRLVGRNPEITKYFKGLKSDPAYDKKGRSYDLASTYSSGGYGQVTPWCAAFVNWCLNQAEAPHLGYATARSWLDFGSPIAYPVYGCLVILKPSKSTGSTTGHIAFFVEFQGTGVKLLGGNQRDAVAEKTYAGSNVLGYRWPTKINNYLLAGTSMQA